TYLGTHGCSDILSKVDELKQAFVRVKEANVMHEKAIQATELKELQLCLFTMSDKIAWNSLCGSFGTLFNTIEAAISTH
ncbi:hypothetical protein Tco_0183171, partial [Tanacetum coccineum]